MKSKQHRRRNAATTQHVSDANAAANQRKRLQAHLMKITEDRTQPDKAREKAAIALQKLLSAPVTRVRQQPTPAKPSEPKVSKFQKRKTEALAALKGSPWDGLLALPEKWAGEVEGELDDDEDDA